MKLIDNCIRIPQIKRHNDKLKEENNYLRISQKNLRDEIMDLKRQKNINNNNFNTERRKFKNEILVINAKNFKKFKQEKNLNEELDNLKENNNNLGKEIEKLKNSKQVIYKDLEKMKKLINENKKINQLNVIQFYTNKEIMSKKYNKNFYIKQIFLKELKEIKNNCGLNVDSDNFKEICLYYIKSKLIENLTDLKTKNIFLNPVITQDGKTYEKDNLRKSDIYVENKLVLEICKILKESGEELTFENFQKIKELLINKKTCFFYKNPIVKTLGVNKGETFEDDNVIFGYKNKVIMNIIEDIRELLDDDFFKFQVVENAEIASDTNQNIINNNTNNFNIIGFEDV